MTIDADAGSDLELGAATAPNVDSGGSWNVPSRRAVWGIPCLTLVALATAAACGDDEKTCTSVSRPGLPNVTLNCATTPISTTGKCLSDEETCQFQNGVSTMMDVKKMLGGPQMTPASNALQYVCDQAASQGVLRHDVVTYWFTDAGVLDWLAVERIGPLAQPVPDCIKAPRASCSSLPRPTEEVMCDAFGTGSSYASCFDHVANTWSSECSANGTCKCSYNAIANCRCTLAEGQIECCPGIPLPR